MSQNPQRKKSHHSIPWHEVSPKKKEWVYLGDDVTFVESSNGNEEYDKFRNDGKAKVYLAVQLRETTTAIKCISWDINDKQKISLVAEDIIPQVRLPDGSTEVTIFGCKVSKTGMLWLCAFDRNFVLCYDLNVKPVPTLKYQVQVPAPNDLCISTTNENIIYVAGGLASNYQSSFLRSLVIKGSNVPTFGEIYRVDCAKFIPPLADIVVPDLHTMSGIYCTDNFIYFTELYTLRRFPIRALKRPVAERRDLVEELWKTSDYRQVDHTTGTLLYNIYLYIILYIEMRKS